MFGVPGKVRSDNGPPFNGYQFKEFAQSQGFKHRRITPAWPQANGLCERFMKNLSKVLKNSKVNNENFETELMNFLRSYRSTPHASTKFSPHHLLFKTESSTSRMPVARKTPDPCNASRNDSKAKQRMKDYIDHKSTIVRAPLHVGDQVLLMNQ